MSVTRASRGSQRGVTSQATDDPSDRTGEPITQLDLIRQYKQRVTQAQVWERPLQHSPELQPLGIVHQGIVVRMEDGKTYLVHKVQGDIEEGTGETIVTDWFTMGIQWAWVKSKEVKSAKLEDYMEKCGDRYNVASDNCQHAVERMWVLD